MCFLLVLRSFNEAVETRNWPGGICKKPPDKLCYRWLCLWAGCLRVMSLLFADDYEITASVSIQIVIIASRGDDVRIGCGAEGAQGVAERCFCARKEVNTIAVVFDLAPCV